LKFVSVNRHIIYWKPSYFGFISRFLQYLFNGLVCLWADFRLQMLDSAAKVECREYASLQLKPVSVIFLSLFGRFCWRC